MDIFEFQKELQKHDIYRDFSTNMIIIFPTELCLYKIDFEISCYINNKKAAYSFSISSEIGKLSKRIRSRALFDEFKYFLDNAFYGFKKLESKFDKRYA